MKNKKGLMGGIIFILILSIILFILTISASIYSGTQFPKEAEEKCNKLDMELFDYSIGNAFTTSTITCWNPETKETRIIK